MLMTKREKKKILTKEEAALVKGMFQYTSLNNQQILSYFIRPDYDINPRVITQIKRNDLHTDVAPASKEEVDAFMNSKYVQQKKSAITAFVEQIHITEDDYIEEYESKYIEFKNDFGMDFTKLVRPILGFSNADGGYILYGVEDNRKICGMSKEKKFDDFDLKDFNNKISVYASSEIKIEKEKKEIHGKKIGILHILPAERKPVITKASASNEGIAVGRIYYRYNAETKEIATPELEKIIEERTELKIKNDFMKLISSLLKDGLSNSLIVNSKTGEMSSFDGNKIIIPEEMLSKINLIREGHFVENGAAPAYVLKGEAQATAIQTVTIPEDISKTHPLTMAEFSRRLTDFFKKAGKIKSNITNTHIKNILYELSMYNNETDHIQERHGNNIMHCLTENSFEKVKIFLEKKDDVASYLKSISQQKK